MKEKPHIELLIVDLDNTLYDWVSFFVPAFYAMIEKAVDILNVDREALLTDIQAVHQKYGNTEQPWALLETEIVKSYYPGKNREELADLLTTAFQEFNRKRDELLNLYPEVENTLQLIKNSGCVIVAHTEAVVSNSLIRSQKLRLLRYISHLYAPPSQGLGHPTGKDLYDDDIEKDFFLELPEAHRKPNPQVLLGILGKYGLLAEKALYIGDSITKDISMAKRAGVHAAWAKYGTQYDKELWEKLVRISHWDLDDLKRESQQRKDDIDFSPDVELGSFSELINYYVFDRTPARGGDGEKNEICQEDKQ